MSSTLSSQPQVVDTVERAIIEARGRTSARIVPVEVPASGRYDHAEDCLALWAAALGLALVLLLVASLPLGGPAKMVQPGRSALAASLGAVALGLAAGVMLAGRLGAMRRLFVPRHVMRQAVRDRANLAFGECLLGLSPAARQELVVLLVSRYERQSAVVVCPRLQAYLTDERVRQIEQAMDRAASACGIPAALAEGVAMAGRMLQEACPAGARPLRVDFRPPAVAC